MKRLIPILCMLTLFSLPIWSADEEEPATTETKEAVEAAAQTAKPGDLGEDVYNIVVEGQIDLSYVFAESPDTFIVSYLFKMEKQVRNKVDIAQGNGKIETKVKGSLAKWPTGECVLTVNVGDFPFEYTFNKTEEEKARVDVKIDGEMMEKWESNCTFTDAPGKKFTTSGNLEKWVRRAFYNIKPALKGLEIPLDRLHKETTKKEFEIEAFLIADPPVGSVELSGKGKISIIPERL